MFFNWETKKSRKENFYEIRRTYGVNRIYSVLKSRGYDYGVKLIRKVMRENDMFVIGTNAKKNYLKRLERKKTFYSKNLMFQDLMKFGLVMLQS